MRNLFGALAVVVIVCLPSLAQFKVENPKNVDFPQAKAEVIYRTACRLVADELRSTKPAEVEFPLTLVLGADDERYTANDKQHAYTVYLNKWNEQLFASSTMMLAIHRLVPRERQQEMLAEILRRANGIAPVDVSTLHGHK